MLRVLLIVLVIPLIGYGISTWIIADLDAQAARVVCSSVLVESDPEVRSACSDIAPILMLQSASVYAALLGIGIPILFWLGSAFAGSNRSRLAIVFPPLIKIVLFLIAISVVMQGAILTYGAYIGESYAIGRVHFFLIGGIGLGAAIAARQLDFVFASIDIADQVRVRALNEPKEWGNSDHCRVAIEIG